MTKINKAGKSTLLIAILSFLLVAVLTFGGTYAYFSASTEADPAKGTITMGKLYVYLANEDNTAILSGDTALTTLTPISLPGQEILDADYTVSLDNPEDADTKSTINALVRVKVTAELDATTYPVTGSGANVVYTGIGDAEKDITPLTIFTITAGGNWYQYGGYAYYVDNSADKENAVLKELTSAAPSAELPINISVNNQVGNGGSTFFMGATGTFSITVEAIQADYLDKGVAAGANDEYKVKDIALAWDKIVDGTYTSTPAQPNGGQ